MSEMVVFLLFLFIGMPALLGFAAIIVRVAVYISEKFPRAAKAFDLVMNVLGAVFVVIMMWPFLTYELWKRRVRNAECSGY
ncbi:hypothetical protein [Thermococcus sp.]